MQNILITGGAGFIGSRLSLELLKRGHQVVVLDNLSKQIHGENPESSTLYQSIQGKVKFIQGSVCDRETVENALKDIDTVVHYAAETGTGQSMYAIEHYTDVNVAGTALLLDVIANNPNKVKKIIVASSRAIYGEGAYTCSSHGTVYPEARSADYMIKGDFEVHCPLCNSVAMMIPTTEDSMVKPASIYGITKYNQEQMFLVVGKALGLTAIAYRYQNVYGAGQSLVNPYTGILSIFSTRIRNGNDVSIFEDGLESRDFVHVDDVVNATVLGIEHKNVIQSVFNVGSGKAINVHDLAQKLRELLNSDVAIKVTSNFRVGDIRHNLADLTKINKVLGYTPKITFDVGLKSFVDWVKTEAVGKDTYEASIKELKEKGLYK
ncbi:MAG: NAD-dependent epimerase/dehydratase family protein [Bdellovibrionales bacterium]|nr:NAD-dependent epimerase/dehydratase family protein [Bdellovibrionales bacterium]